MVLDLLSTIAIVYLGFKLVFKLVAGTKRNSETTVATADVPTFRAPIVTKAITRRTDVQLQLDAIRESYVKATKSVAPDSTTLETLRAHGLYPTKYALEVRTTPVITSELLWLLNILHKEGKVLGIKGRDVTFGSSDLKKSEKLWIITETPYTAINSISAFVA